MTTARTPRTERGATLIEVLVAMLILALGLLGTAALQSSAQQAEMESYQRSQGLILAQDMINRINANRRAARCYETYSGAGDDNFVGQGNDPTPCTGWGTTSTRDRADDDMAQWDALLTGASELLDGNNVGSMTGARGCVRFDEIEEVYIVTVAWQGQRPTRAPDDNDCAQGTYGEDDLRRIVELTLRIGNLS